VVPLADALKLLQACFDFRMSGFEVVGQLCRQHYYDIKQAIVEDGIEGLLEKSRRSPRIGNRVAPEIEQRVIDYAVQFPIHGQTRVANELKRKAVMSKNSSLQQIPQFIEDPAGGQV